MEKIEQIKLCANLTRKWAEKNYDLFYANDKLTGMCAICSYIMSECFDYLNIKYKFVMTNFGFGNHVFIKYQNVIVDVTATQFNGQELNLPEIVIEPIKKKQAFYWWFTNPKEFTKNKFENCLEDWSSDQQPFAEEGDLREEVKEAIGIVKKALDKTEK
jgi:hypothetical protein